MLEIWIRSYQHEKSGRGNWRNSNIQETHWRLSREKGDMLQRGLFLVITMTENPIGS